MNDNKTITQAEYDALYRRSLILEHVLAHEDNGTIFLDKLTVGIYKKFLGMDQKKETAE